MSTTTDNPTRTPWSMYRKTNPAQRVLSLQELKRMLRLSVDDETHDEILLFYIDAATGQVEHDCSMGLIDQTWIYTRDAFPKEKFIELPIRWINALVECRYSGGVVANLTIDRGRNQLKLPSEQTWPTGEDLNIEVEYTVGFGADVQSVPAELRQAVAMQAGKFFNNPTMDMSESMSGGDAAYERLIWRYMRSDYP